MLHITKTLLYLSPRPVSDGRVADVVHEGTRGSSSSSVRSRSRSFNGSNEDGVGGGSARSTSTVAEATLTGTLNGKPLWLQRRKGVRVNQLFLKHDGKDLTRQVAKCVPVPVAGAVCNENKQCSTVSSRIL